MTEVVIGGWTEDVGAILEFAFMVGVAFGVVVVALVTAAALALLTRRGL